MKTHFFLQNVLIENCIKKTRKAFYKYDGNEDQHNRFNINDIIYDEQKHLVSVFKEYLLWDETSDFLRR